MIIDACALKTNLEIYTSKNHSLRERRSCIGCIFSYERYNNHTQNHTHSQSHTCNSTLARLSMDDGTII